MEVLPPKGEKTCQGSMLIVMQNVTPISATIAKIAVTEQEKQQT